MKKPNLTAYNERSGSPVRYSAAPFFDLDPLGDQRVQALDFTACQADGQAQFEHAAVRTSGLERMHVQKSRFKLAHGKISFIWCKHRRTMQLRLFFVGLKCYRLSIDAERVQRMGVQTFTMGLADDAIASWVCVQGALDSFTP